ncbi:MAG: carboxypeptidase-like regulatory domain-containing protein, partial [Agriterribacter sp.]
MNFTAILLLSVSLTVSAGSYSQITLHEKNASLSKVFRQIQKQTGYEFLYSYELLQQAGKVSITVTNASLQQVLDLCLKNKPLSYSIIDRTIVLKPKIIEPVMGQTVQQLPPVTVKGRVTDESGNPLEGVSVQVKGGASGTNTNANGEYSIDIPESAAKVLVFSFVGMESQEVNVSGRTQINVSLRSKDVQQEEITIVAYGTQRKSQVTAAMSSVKGADLVKTQAVDLGSAMQGMAAGVTVTTPTGAPGADAVVRIRGIGTLN